MSYDHWKSTEPEPYEEPPEVDEAGDAEDAKQQARLVFPYKDHRVEIIPADGYAEEGQRNRGYYDILIDDEWGKESIVGEKLAIQEAKKFIDMLRRLDESAITSSLWLTRSELYAMKALVSQGFAEEKDGVFWKKVKT